MFRLQPCVALVGTLALGACAFAPPTGPSIAAMPPSGKNLAEFQGDDMACRQYATQLSGGAAPTEAAQQSQVNSAALGTVLGAAAGAAIGAAAGNPAAGAAIGAGSGLLLGTASGAGAAEYSGAAVQRQYDIGYAQCMASKGNSVPQIASAASYAPPPYPYPYPYPYPAPYPYYGPAYYGPGFYGPGFIGVGWGWGGRGHRWR